MGCPLLLLKKISVAFLLPKLRTAREIVSQGDCEIGTVTGVSSNGAAGLAAHFKYSLNGKTYYSEAPIHQKNSPAARAHDSWLWGACKPLKNEEQVTVLVDLNDRSKCVLYLSSPYKVHRDESNL